jgi:hypothetical protein
MPYTRSADSAQAARWLTTSRDALARISASAGDATTVPGARAERKMSINECATDNDDVGAFLSPPALGPTDG